MNSNRFIIELTFAAITSAMVRLHKLWSRASGRVLHILVPTEYVAAVNHTVIAFRELVCIPHYR